MYTHVAGVQAKFFNGDINGNLQIIRRFVKECMRQRPEVKLLLFPELSATGYFLSDELYDVAEKSGGYIESEMSKVANEYSVYLAYGYVEREDDNKIYNSLKIIDPEGKSIGNYRKIHLTPLEKNYFSSGNEIVLVETTLGKIGLMICWDLAFSELARELANRGADILLAPSAWESPYDKPYHHFGVARAIDNTLFLVTVNHIGKSGELSFFGESSIYGPDGECITVANDSEKIIFAALDQNRRQELKETFYSMLSERRTDVYRSW